MSGNPADLARIPKSRHGYEAKAQVEALVRQGLSVTEIERRTGVPLRTIKAWKAEIVQDDRVSLSLGEGVLRQAEQRAPQLAAAILDRATRLAASDEDDERDGSQDMAAEERRSKTIKNLVDAAMALVKQCGAAGPPVDEEAALSNLRVKPDLGADLPDADSLLGEITLAGTDEDPQRDTSGEESATDKFDRLARQKRARMSEEEAREVREEMLGPDPPATPMDCDETGRQ